MVINAVAVEMNYIERLSSLRSLLQCFFKRREGGRREYRKLNQLAQALYCFDQRLGADSMVNVACATLLQGAG